MIESKIPGVKIGNPPKPKLPARPHYVLSIHLMHGDADFYEWDVIAKFDQDGRPLDIYGDKLKNISVNEDYPEGFPVADLPIRNASLACQLAKLTYPNGKGGYDDYSNVPGFDVWCDGLSDREMGVPSIEDWKLVYVDTTGIEYPAEIEFTAEQQAYIANYDPEAHHGESEEF